MYSMVVGHSCFFLLPDTFDVFRTFSEKSNAHNLVKLGLEPLFQCISVSWSDDNSRMDAEAPKINKRAT